MSEPEIRVVVTLGIFGAVLAVPAFIGIYVERRRRRKKRVSLTM